MAGIVVVTKFVQPGSKQFAAFIEYIDDDKKTRAKGADKYSAFMGEYMPDPDKSTGIFTATSDSLSAGGKKRLAEIFDEAQERGSLMWQTVISFDEDFLKEHALIGNGGELNEKSLIGCTRAAMNAYTKKEGMEGFVWSASFHRNVKENPDRSKGEHTHYHVHIAMVDPEPSWQEGERRCRRNKNGELYQRGVVPLSTLEQTKSAFVSAAVSGSNESKKIGELRDKFLSFHKESLSRSEFTDDIKQLKKKLPSNKRLWKYNMNAMAHLRPEIDRITKNFIDTYLADDYHLFDYILDVQSNKYLAIYGTSFDESRKNYKENKINDLYARLGNQLLSAIREMPDEQESMAKASAASPMPAPDGAPNPAGASAASPPPEDTSSFFLVKVKNKEEAESVHRGESPYIRLCRNIYLPQIDIYALRRLFKKDINTLKNQAAYEKFTREAERG